MSNKVSRVDSLTDEQKARMPEWRDKWIAIGRCTQPADRANFERNIAICYKAAKKEPPQHVIWVNSPREVSIVAPYVDYHHTNKGVAVEVAVARARELVKLSNEELRSRLTDEERKFIRSNWSRYIGGQFWAGWQAFATFMIEVCNLELKDNLNEAALAYAECAKSAAWYWPAEKFCVVSERPEVMKFDENNRLHSTTGPAIKFRDGRGTYYFHGTRVPDRAIENPESYTSEELRAIDNSEVVRALAEILGWEKFLEKMGVVVVDTWKDPTTKLTYELLDPAHRHGEDEPRFLRMQSPVIKDGTQPVYIEPVDPNLKTAKAARRWQFRKENGDWPSVEECNKSPSLQFGAEA